MTKESLAAKPIKYVLTDSQRHLSIGYNLAAGQLTLKNQGVDVEKLPPVALNSQICQHKIVDTSTGITRQTQFHAIFDNERYVITASYL